MTDAQKIVPKMKFNEEDFLNDVIRYMRATYEEHYATGDQDQTVEYIQSLDSKNSLMFLKGNVIKYISRYGKKAGHNKKDLLKAIHYICFMDYFAQEQEKQGE